MGFVKQPSRRNLTMSAIKTGLNASMKTAIQGAGGILCIGVLGTLFSGQAGAACMDLQAATAQGSSHQSPLLSFQAPAADDSRRDAERIVGTWQVSYASGGSVYAEAFIQWHSDGTEWENIDFPILGGNICLGSWKAVNENRVSRYHVGWLYTDGILSGHFIETETDELSHDGNSYSGHNDTKFYKLDGTMFQEVIGTAAAKRIAP
jgi:hypothetical protein